MDSTDREWDDPEPTDERERRARYRIFGGLVGLVVGLVIFSPTLQATLPRLWPPGGERWLTLVLFVGLALMLPLMVGAAIGETLARFRR